MLYIKLTKQVQTEDIEESLEDIMKQDNDETEHVEKHREEKLLRERLKLSIFLMKHLKKNDLTDLDSKIVNA
jgi:hypothetical protein